LPVGSAAFWDAASPFFALVVFSGGDNTGVRLGATCLLSMIAAPLCLAGVICGVVALRESHGVPRERIAGWIGIVLSGLPVVVGPVVALVMAR
jgi:hypothetical protein